MLSHSQSNTDSQIATTLMLDPPFLRQETDQNSLSPSRLIENVVSVPSIQDIQMIEEHMNHTGRQDLPSQPILIMRTQSMNDVGSFEDKEGFKSTKMAKGLIMNQGQIDFLSQKKEKSVRNLLQPSKKGSVILHAKQISNDQARQQPVLNTLGATTKALQTLLVTPDAEEKVITATLMSKTSKKPNLDLDEFQENKGVVLSRNIKVNSQRMSQEFVVVDGLKEQINSNNSKTKNYDTELLFAKQAPYSPSKNAAAIQLLGLVSPSTLTSGATKRTKESPSFINLKNKESSNYVLERSTPSQVELSVKSTEQIKSLEPNQKLALPSQQLDSTGVIFKPPKQVEVLMKLKTQKLQKQGHYMLDESVKFIVQPQKNNLITPCHPLITKQIEKLQNYKEKMHRRGLKQISKIKDKKDKKLVTAANVGANTNPLTVLLTEIGESKNSTSGILWVENTANQIDPNVIETAASINASRCTTSFKIKMRSLRSSVTRTSGSQGSPVISKSGFHQSNKNLPIHFVNHNNVHQKNRLKGERRSQLSIKGESTGKNSVSGKAKTDVKNVSEILRLQARKNLGFKKKTYNNDLSEQTTVRIIDHQLLSDDTDLLPKNSHDIMIRENNGNLLDGKTRLDSEFSYLQSTSTHGNVLHSIEEQTGSNKDADAQKQVKLNSYLRMKVPSVQAEPNSADKVQETDTISFEPQAPEIAYDVQDSPKRMSKYKDPHSTVRKGGGVIESQSSSKIAQFETPVIRNIRPFLQQRLQNISRSSMLDENQSIKLNQTLGPTNQNDQLQQQELNDLSNIPQMTISINKKETQYSAASPKMNFNEIQRVDLNLSKPGDREGSIYSQVDQKTLEDVVKSFNEELIHPKLLQSKFTEKTGHIHYLHELHKKIRPVSQNLQRKRDRVTRKRLQKILNLNSAKIAGVNTRLGTPFTFGPEGSDIHHVLSGSFPHNQYQKFLGEYGIFNLAEDVSREQLQVDGSLESEEQTFSRLEQTLIHGLKHPRSAMANYAFQPSIMHQLNNDLKFKQVFKGIPQTREVKARRTQTGFNLTHKGKFSFSQPREIHFEIKKKLQKKHADMSSTLRTQPNAESKEYNLQIKSKRVNLTVTSRMPSQQIESTNDILMPRMICPSNLSIPTYQAITTELLNTVQDQKRGSSTNSGSHGSQKSSKNNNSPGNKRQKKSNKQSVFMNIFDVHETVIDNQKQKYYEQIHKTPESTIRRTIDLNQEGRSNLLMIESRKDDSTSQNQTVGPGPKKVPTINFSKNNGSMEEIQDQESSRLQELRFSTQFLHNDEQTNHATFQPANLGWKGVGTISLNNNKLWLKQFGKASNKTYQTSRSQAQISGNNYRKPYLQTSQLNILLSNTLREINKKIPVKVIVNSNYSNRAATAMLRRHHQRVFSQEQSTQCREKQGNKARPISENHNLFSNKKNSRLSSYAHPKNNQHSQESMTDPLVRASQREQY